MTFGLALFCSGSQRRDDVMRLPPAQGPLRARVAVAVVLTSFLLCGACTSTHHLPNLVMNSSTEVRSRSALPTPAVSTTTPVVTSLVPDASASSTVATASAPAGTLRPGLYADGRPGTPHYYVLLRRTPDGGYAGTLAFLAQNGASGEVRTFTGPPEQANEITVTYNDGKLDVLSDNADGAFELSGCQTYLTRVHARPDCTFSLHPTQDLSPGTAVPTTQAGASFGGYRIYSDTRFGFSTLVPTSFIEGAQTSTGTGRASNFTSSDTRAEVTLAGYNNSNRATAPEVTVAMRLWLDNRGGTVTYQDTSSSTIAAVSGTYPSNHGTMLYYFRAVVGAGSVDTLTWIYPFADKSADDKYLKQSVQSFRAGDLSSAH